MAKILTRKGLEITSSPAESLDAGNQKIINVADPSNEQDVATKAYVDSAASSAAEALDGTFRIKNTTDETKELAFDASAITTATTRTIIMPDANVDLGLVASAIQSSEKGANNGVATLNAAGKLTSTQVPAIAITETFVVADITARDALTVGAGDGEVQEGDVAIVTDASGDAAIDSGGASYIYDGSAWQLLKTPDSPVQSVNGETGTVVLDTDDITEGASNLYWTSTRFDDAFALKDSDDLDEGASNLYFTEARVLASVLTGLSTSSDAAVTSSDSVLSAIGKLQARTKKGSFAESAAPAASNDSTENFEVGSLWYDQSANKLYIAEDVTENAAVWQLLNPDAAAAPVDSVNGATGVVVLDTDDIDEGSSNLYFTDARAKSAAVADSITDGVTDVAPSQNAVFDALALKADDSDLTAAENDISDLQSDSGLVFEAGVAGESFAANQIWLVRRAKSGETAGRYYKAQADSSENSRAVGFIVVGASALSAADSIRVYKLGSGTLGSSDTAFTAPTDLNAIVYLSQTVAGKWTLTPTSAPGDWIKEIGFVADATVLEFQQGLLIQA